MEFVPGFTIHRGNLMVLAVAAPHQAILSVPKSRQYCQLPPGGKPRGANQSRLPFIQLLAKIRGYGRMLSAPTGCGEAFGFRHVPYRVYALLEKRQLFQCLPQLFNIDAGIVHHQLMQIPGGIVMVEAAQRLHPDAPASEP